ncbi:Palmitoyltransferase zdhhc15 [Perkinsus olseni]|uniref:Palmitoyltransferase zdhhc15 n=2 Tax=Perkinsus olseni TaxID=32597 RepID=A0A7J6UH44_PEROL|nr:Palmitoyltransferase zdhhc15 [Perkinsus olseni]
MPDRSPYDVGLIKNWQSVMGRNFLTWLLPTGPRGIGDGLAFPINSQAKDVLEKELGITVTPVDGGDLEAGRRRSRGRGSRVGLGSDDEEDDSNAEIRKALEYRQQQLAEAVEEPEAPPSPASDGSSSSTAASYPTRACCSGAAGGGGSLVEYGLEKSNEFADFITDLYMSGWKILAGPRRGGKKRRGQEPAVTTPIQSSGFDEPPTSPGLVEVGSPIQNIATEEEPKAAA